ncbi:cytochrome C oxidase subunit IV family protein [Woeseia oceani]|uniref:Cytochrome C oxidase subunit IV n=1 Tax=Woeseia oceani TaxID=1548547 RepID=A0A193LIY7_9GAMM|nr:cytochrome C oxidase subunit IV family protein [Woeseia oceani]ANO52408.1 cytochrome C oxidase subunit IV [Woeseia oceani]
MAQEQQQHPLAIYFWIWGLLFVVSTLSYMVDYIGFQGYLRWTLILVFMFIKAGFIIAIFMHMTWERRALQLAILVPPVAILVLIGLMSLEGDYTFLTRIEFFGESSFVPESPHH